MPKPLTAAKIVRMMERELRTRPVDTTERCAKCGKRGQRNEMCFSWERTAANPAQWGVWYHAQPQPGQSQSCWDARNEPKESEHAEG